MKFRAVALCALLLASGCTGKSPAAKGAAPSSDQAPPSPDTAANAKALTSQADSPAGERGASPGLAAPLDCSSPPGALDPPPIAPPPHDPHKAVRNLHQTWQHDPSTTVTLTWTTQFKDLDSYMPMALYAQASEVCGDGRKLLSAKAKHAKGSGLLYDTVSFEAMEKAVTWSVELTGLQPDTEYAFAVGNWQSFDPASGHFEQPNLSQPGRFRTAPAKGSRAPMRFVMAGDSRGGSAKIHMHSKRFAAIPALAWFFTGDMSVAGIQPQWDDWFDAMGPVLASKPLMPVQGNHEILAEIHYSQFALPVAPGLEADFVEHAWSLDIGNVHMIGLDSNTEVGIAAQVPWLIQDLQAAQKNPDIDWIFAMMHHPAYSASTVHGSSPAVQQHWVPLFEKYGVDVVFAGHDHCYERSLPILAGKPSSDKNGVTYVVAGGFFAPAYQNGKDWWTAVSHHGDKNNYVEIAVDGKTLDLHAWSGDGTEKLDHVQLQR